MMAHNGQCRGERGQPVGLLASLVLKEKLCGKLADVFTGQDALPVTNQQHKRTEGNSEQIIIKNHSLASFLLDPTTHF